MKRLSYNEWLDKFIDEIPEDATDRELRVAYLSYIESVEDASIETELLGGQ